MKLRSILALAPGEHGSEAVVASEADAVLFTLANADRPPADLRRAAVEAMPGLTEAGKRVLVLVNHPRTGLLRDDLDVIVGRHCSAVLLPHCTEPQQVRDAAVLLREFEYARDIEPGAINVFPVIDTAKGVLRAADIVAAAQRVAGLVFDADGYARDVGGRAEELGSRFAYARGAVVAVARADDGLPIISGAHVELRTHAQFGFAGAIVADMAVVPAANQAFTPTESATKRARALRDAYAAARSEGLLVGRVGNEVADAASVRKALHTLHAAEGEGDQAPG